MTGKAPTGSALDVAHAAGRQAAVEGRPVRACPYSPTRSPALCLAWLNGHAAGMRAD